MGRGYEPLDDEKHSKPSITHSSKFSLSGSVLLTHGQPENWAICALKNNTVKGKVKLSKGKKNTAIQGNLRREAVFDLGEKHKRCSAYVMINTGDDVNLCKGLACCPYLPGR